MAIVEVESFDDPRLDTYRDLKRSNATRWAETFVAEGDKLTERLLGSDYEVKSLLVGRRLHERYADAAERGLDILVVPDEWIENLVGVNFHRGVLACGRRKANPVLEQLLPRDGANAVIVVCPDMQDPENLGSILRISAAFGASRIVLGPESADFLSRRVLRVSMGAGLQLAIRRSDDLGADLRALRSLHGFEIWGTVVDGSAEALALAARPARLAVLFGHQAHGLSDEALALCDRRITIPMQAGIDSLNVAVTAGIVLYKLLRESSLTQ